MGHGVLIFDVESKKCFQIGHFTVIDGSEADGDLVLIQTFFALLWKLFLKNAS